MYLLAESSVAALTSFSTIFVNLAPLVGIAGVWAITLVAFPSVDSAAAEVPAVLIRPALTRADLGFRVVAESSVAARASFSAVFVDLAPLLNIAGVCVVVTS